MFEKDYEKFMFESNRIEGEEYLNPGDIDALMIAIADPDWDKEVFLKIHNKLGGHKEESWVGKWRTCNVQVGPYYPPRYDEVPALMNWFIGQLPKMNSWKAHNEFEKIHPFQDLNGRMGRLLWLSKAIRENYDFEIPFLQKYYYQTLERYEKGDTLG